MVKKKSKPTEKKKAGRLKKDKVEGRPKGPKSGPCSGSLKAGPKKWGILKDDETSVKFKNREDAIFYFPQDESLRDPSLRFHCTLCVRGFDVGKMLRQHFRYYLYVKNSLVGLPDFRVNSSDNQVPNAYVHFIATRNH